MFCFPPWGMSISLVFNIFTPASTMDYEVRIQDHYKIRLWKWPPNYHKGNFRDLLWGFSWACWLTPHPPSAVGSSSRSRQGPTRGPSHSLLKLCPWALPKLCSFDTCSKCCKFFPPVSRTISAFNSDSCWGLFPKFYFFLNSENMIIVASF